MVGPGYSIVEFQRAKQLTMILFFFFSASISSDDVMPDVESVLSRHIYIKLDPLKGLHQIKSASGIRMERDDFPYLITGLGCLPDIELAEVAVPVVHPPRKLPVPQREKVVEELKWMETAKSRSDRAAGRTNGMG